MTLHMLTECLQGSVYTESVGSLCVVLNSQEVSHPSRYERLSLFSPAFIDFSSGASHTKEQNILECLINAV